MKRSEKATGYRLVAANCGDEYSTCVAAIIRVDSAMLEKWRYWDKVCSEMKSQFSDFVVAEYMGVDVTFLSSMADVQTGQTADGEEEYENWADILGDTGDIWVETTDDDSDDDYVVVEDRIWGTTICISGDGLISFKGNGKHSGTEYWTESIKLEELQ